MIDLSQEWRPCWVVIGYPQVAVGGPGIEWRDGSRRAFVEAWQLGTVYPPDAPWRPASDLPDWANRHWA